MNEHGLFRRRQLPHIDVEGKPYFITACLHGSISAVGLARIRLFRDELDARPLPKDLTPTQWEAHKHKLMFKFVDDLLDGANPIEHLSDSRLAIIVQDAFLHFAEERYDLFAFVVMPSHHHWVFLPRQSWIEQSFFSTSKNGLRRSPREAISHSIQSFTSTSCNRILGRSGPFWQTETFDHFARDEEELIRIIHYIEHNPVKAGLVEKPHEWQWSSAAIRYRLHLDPTQPIPKPVG
jgi:putative transposase